MITTENMNITKEQANKITAAFSRGNCPAIVAKKYEVYRVEIINYLAAIAPDFKVGASDSVYYLFLWAERIANQRARDEIAFSRSAAQSARTQLKAWDWPGLK